MQGGSQVLMQWPLPAYYVNERLTQFSTQPRLNVGQNPKLDGERERERAHR